MERKADFRESVDIYVTRKLESAQEELANTEERLRNSEVSWRRTIEDYERGVKRADFSIIAVHRLERDIVYLKTQVQMLKEIKDLVDKQQIETKAQFLAIEKRDTVSSKQSFWLTVVSSTISLIAGWLLSLVGSPATVLRIFAH